jgi:hypothetical protein
VLSLAFWVKPDLHCVHSPVPAAHSSHPSWQTEEQLVTGFCGQTKAAYPGSCRLS